MTLLACEDGGCTSSLEAYLLLEAKLTRKAVYLSGHGNIVLPGRVRGVRTLYDREARRWEGPACINPKPIFCFQVENKSLGRLGGGFGIR
jgi:hypothetical protein